MELFVLDDGWFGARCSDFAGLGDWTANTDRLPDGITGLAERIEALGMKFGLWFEPEMVNKDSDLYRTHPDWILQTPGRRASQGRNQFVLDFSRPEVVDHIYGMMAKILSEAKVSYIKWDMNRSITEAYSAALPPDQQGEALHPVDLMVGRCRHMGPHGADRVAEGGAVLDFQPLHRVGVIGDPALGGVVEDARVKPAAAGGAGLTPSCPPLRATLPPGWW